MLAFILRLLKLLHPNLRVSLNNRGNEGEIESRRNADTPQASPALARLLLVAGERTESIFLHKIMHH